MSVLYLPILFDGTTTKRFEKNFIVAPGPSPELTKLAKAIERQAEVTPPKPSITKPSDLTVALTPTVKTLKKQNKSRKLLVSMAYVVQVASFADKKNALKLIQKLKKQKLDGYIGKQRVKRGKSVFSRVLVGPVINKKRADEIVLRVKKLLGANSSAKAVEFDPLRH